MQEEIKHSEDRLGADNANTQQTRAYLAEVLAKTGNKVRQSNPYQSKASVLHCLSARC